MTGTHACDPKLLARKYKNWLIPYQHCTLWFIDSRSHATAFPGAMSATNLHMPLSVKVSMPSETHDHVPDLLGVSLFLASLLVNLPIHMLTLFALATYLQVGSTVAAIPD